MTIPKIAVIPMSLMLQGNNANIKPDMAKMCAITGKSSQVAGGYSNKTRATQYNPTGKRRQRANIQKKTFFISEIDKKVTIQVSARGLKTIHKKGAYKALKDAGVI